MWRRRTDMKPLNAPFCARELLYFGLMAIGLFTFALARPDAGLVSHFSFAGAVASIVLAVVAIVYTMIHSAESTTALLEIRREALNLQHGARRLSAETKGMRKRFDELMGRPSVAGPEVQNGTDTASEIDFGYASPAGLLALHWLARAFDGNKASTLEILAEETGISHESKAHIITFLTGVSCRLSSARVAVEESTWRIKDLPGTFLDAVRKRVKAEVAEGKTHQDEREQGFAGVVELAHRKVDEYFDR
jgi:hypothetical protein